MRKIMADAVSGVYTVSSFDDFNGCTVLSQQDFYESLSALSNDEIIGAEIDDEMFSKIKSEYGITVPFCMNLFRLSDMMI